MPDEYGDSPSFEEGFDDGGNNEVPCEPTPIKLPQQNIEAERALIGSVLRDNNQFERCAAILRSTDFFQAHHLLIWDTISEYHKLGSPFDMVSIAETLTSRGKIEELGPSREAYMYDLWKAGEVSSNATMYADIVKKHSQKRLQQSIAARMMNLANSNMPPEEFTSSFIAAQEEMVTGAKPRGWYPKPMSIAQLDAAEYDIVYYIEKVMTKDSPMIVGGPLKSMKTSILCDFLVSLATGTPFLGKYAVPHPKKVFFMSSESGAAQLKQIIRRICVQRGVNPREVVERGLIQFNQPCLSNPEEMARLGRFIKTNGIDVVVFDPTYLSLLAGNTNAPSAGNLFEMGPLYAGIAEVCLSNGATPVLAFHANKGNAVPGDEPLELHNLSFAGIAEFAGQWILLRRRIAWRPGHNDLVVVMGGRDDSRGMVANVTIKEHTLEGGLCWDVSVTDRHAPAEAQPQQGDGIPAEGEDYAAAAEAAATANYWAEVFSRCHAFLRDYDTKHEGLTYRDMMRSIDPKVHSRDTQQFKLRILKDERFEEVLVMSSAGRGERGYQGVRLKVQPKQETMFNDEHDQYEE